MKAKTFKEGATTLDTSISTILRRFAQQAKAVLGVSLGKAYVNILLDLAVT